MKNIRKKQKQEGITLIALVVTIVVLLILAGTSIAMLTGDNGIITNAQKAQMANTKAEVTEKMNMAYNAAYSEARVKLATNSGYQPSASIADLAEIVAKELGVDAETTDVPTTGIDNGYHVYYKTNGTTITMLYGDKKFALEADTEEQNNLYPNIKGEITLSTTQVTYTKQPDGTTSNPTTPSTGTITVENGTGIDIGDVISIQSTKGTKEEFYIISYNETTKKAVALAKNNLENAEAIAFAEEVYWGQETGNYVPFGDTSYPYVYDENSNIYSYLENYKTELGNSVSRVRLAAYEEIEELMNATEDYKWAYSTNYWLGSANDQMLNYMYVVSENNKSIGVASFSDSSNSGIRPVIEFDAQSEK